ncbi:hypothetical protein LR48_Vigan11g136700 [Vigna angularis]|nr:cytochrome P450 81E8 [Vigna angularis]KAG2380928.1 Cytochrome P450 [Vigna angularis]KOM58333.1 hypothetical protein LR48_Vigan11g136700 [Vigna angularis]
MALLYFALLILLFLFSLKLLFQTRRFRNLPPGPLSYPIIGNLLQLKQPYHRTFSQMSQKYGSVFSLWFGSRLVVVVCSQSAVQECFTKNDIVLANRPHFLFGKYISYNNSTILHSSYGDHWRHLRRILSLEVVSATRLNSFYEVRRDEIMRLVQKLAKLSSHQFTKVDLKAMFMETSFNTMMRIVSGKRLFGDDCDVNDVEKAKEFKQIIKELVILAGVNNRGDFLPFVRWFDFDNLEKKLKGIGKRTDAFLQELIEEHRNGKNNGNTMIDHLLAQQKSQPEQYTDQIIKGLSLSLLLAGTDTSALTLEWAMANLLNHPEVIKKAKNEIDTYVGPNRLIEESDMSKLSYIQCIVYETLRLHPAAPIWSPHLSSEDCIVGKYNLPKDTIVLVNAWAAHMDPEMWSDPTHFKPERFENENEVNRLLSFGLGRRACPGSNLAQRTVGLSIALLLQCFEWKRIGKEEIDMSEANGITISRKNSLEAMCQLHRSPAVKDMY